MSKNTARKVTITRISQVKLDKLRASVKSLTAQLESKNSELNSLAKLCSSKTKENSELKTEHSQVVKEFGEEFQKWQARDKAAQEQIRQISGDRNSLQSQLDEVLSQTHEMPESKECDNDDQIQALNDRIEELEAENSELKQQLSTQALFDDDEEEEAGENSEELEVSSIERNGKEFLIYKDEEFPYDFTADPTKALDEVIELRNTVAKLETQLSQKTTQLKAKSGKTKKGKLISEHGNFKLSDFVEVMFGNKPSELAQIDELGKKRAKVSMFRDGLWRHGYAFSYDKLTLCLDQDKAKNSIETNIKNSSELILKLIDQENSDALKGILRKWSGLKHRDFFINRCQSTDLATHNGTDSQLTGLSQEYAVKFEEVLGKHPRVVYALKFHFKFEHNMKGRKTRLSDEEKAEYAAEKAACNRGEVTDIKFDLYEKFLAGRKNKKAKSAAKKAAKADK
jgi:hypothetical protein